MQINLKMGLFDFFYDRKKDFLLRQNDFTANYILDVSNIFKFGKENTPIQLETSSDITLHQEVEGSSLKNTIHLQQIRGNAVDENMQSYLDESLLLAEITKNISVERSTKGTLRKVLNKDKLWQDWELWKETRLAEVYPDEQKQMKFAKTYAEGLRKFDEAFRLNIQYIFLLPEIYHVIFPPNREYSYLSSEKTYHSRLIEGLRYDYQLKLVQLNQTEDSIDVTLHAVVNNSSTILEYLKPNYEQSAFTVSDFSFTIEIKYTLETNTSKITSGQLLLIEKMHDDLYYQIKMNLSEGVKEVLSEGV